MPDNVVLNAGAGGSTMAADDIASVFYQRIKVSVGADGTAVDMIPVSAGLDTTATGVPAVGLVAQLDDTAPSAVTENQFAPVRLSTRRALLVEGVASGTNVNVIAAANSGVDIGDVTINNAAGASAVNVQDGGNAITVDGTVDITELPAAAALADATANPTTTAVGTMAHAFNGTTWDRLRGSTTGLQAIGGLAHDAANTSANNPQVIGAEAIAYGTNPTAVAAADVTKLYANRAGVLHVIGGHPNIVTLELAATAAQTDVAVVTIGAGLKIVVTQIQLMTAVANTVAVGFRVGFGAVTTPTTTGVVATHPGMNPGSGISRGDGSGILGVGADNEDLRITSDVPTGGSLRVLVSYHTIES